MKQPLLDRARSIMKRNAASKAALAILPLAAATHPAQASTFLSDPVAFASIFRITISGGTPPPPPPPPATPKPAVAAPVFAPLPKAVTEIASPIERPGLGGVPFDISLGAADLHTDVLEERMQMIHDASETGSTVALGGAPLASAGKDNKESKDASPARQQEQRFSYFVAGSGLFENINGSGSNPGFHTTTAGVTAGVDYRVTPNLVVGVTGGYEGTDASLAHRGRLSVDTGRGGVYAMSCYGPWYANIVALGGGSAYDGHFSHGDASPGGSEVDSAIRFGYDMRVNHWKIGPTLEVRYNHVEVDGFDFKTTAGTDRFTETDSNSLRTRLGVRATTSFQCGPFTLRPEIQVAWQHEYLDRDQSIDGFAPDGSKLTDAGVPIGRDSLLVHAGVTSALTDRWSLFLYYMGDLARKNYTSHTVTGGVNYGF